MKAYGSSNARGIRFCSGALACGVLILLLVAGPGQCAADMDNVVFSEDFETSLMIGLHGLCLVTSDDGILGVPGLNEGNHAAYFQSAPANNPISPSPVPATGEAEIELILPVLHEWTAFQLRFDYWRDTEYFLGGPFDRAIVEIRLDDDPWVMVWTRNSMTPSKQDWIAEDAIPPFLTQGASRVRVRFTYDAVDNRENDHIGWLLDNVQLIGTAESEAKPLEDLAVYHGARYEEWPQARRTGMPTPSWQSLPAEVFVILVYDVTGELVLVRRETNSTTLLEYLGNLANGIYLMYANVLIGGEWYSSPFEKVAIVR